MVERARRGLTGDPDGLAFGFQPASRPAADLRGLGWGDLVLWVAGRPVWSRTDDGGTPIRWSWIDLVSHLARIWPYLLHEESAPFGLVAAGPELLRQKRHLNGVAGRSSGDVEAAIHGYQYRHDLAAGIGGIVLPSVWVLPEGNTFRIRAAGRDAWVTRRQGIRLLSAIAETVLSSVGADRHARAEEAAKLWRQRQPSPAAERLLRSGLTSEEIRRLETEGIAIEAPGAGRDSGEEVRETPLLAVARLTAALPFADRVRVLRAISRPPQGAPAPEMEALAVQARHVLATHAASPPYAQGHAMALWLREELSLGDDRCDPRAILRRWRVRVEQLPRDISPRLDAVACWAEGRLPIIWVNPAGRHAHAPAGLHATLAHEVAHILLDRGTRLPAAEAFGGSTPLHLEQRARAFAAELLLPRHVAAITVAHAADLATARAALMQRYGVSQEVIGWQIRNGASWGMLGAAERNQVARWVRRFKV